MKNLKIELLSKFEAILELHCTEDTQNLGFEVTIGDFTYELEIYDARLAYKNDYTFCGEFKGCQGKESEHKFEFSALVVKTIWDIETEDFKDKAEVEEVNKLFDNIYIL